MAVIRFTCSCCGKQHDGLPDVGFVAPAVWHDALATDDPEGNQLGTDFCIVGEHRFIHCVLLISIRDTDEQFGWGVWVSQSQANFQDYVDTFRNNPEKSTFGYLSNQLPLYPDTLNMVVRARWKASGDRPRVELKPCDHPLYRDWHDGITMERAIEFAQLSLHPPKRQDVEETDE